MTNFTEDQLAQLKIAQQKRYSELQEEVRRELGHSNDPQYVLVVHQTYRMTLIRHWLTGKSSKCASLKCR